MIEKPKIFKNTQDNWYGNFPNNQVSIELLQWKNEYSICCEGTDDFMLSKIFVDKEEALDVYEQISNWEFVNHKDLYELGFVPD